MCFYLEKNTCCIVGASEVLGPKGYWGVELIALTNPTLNLYPVSKMNHVEIIELIFMGILLLGMSYHLT
jgi:hypothetical protein